jgi:hypothetical protein
MTQCGARDWDAVTWGIIDLSFTLSLVRLALGIITNPHICPW